VGGASDGNADTRPVLAASFLIVDFWLLIDNGDARFSGSIKTKNPTGPSTNGRSSAFGALCLGSNPSGPARKQFSVPSSQFSVRN
jgi:hypothetical protein